MSLATKKVDVHDGIVSLTLRCLTRKVCKGALLLETPSAELSRVSLKVPGRTEWIIDVTLTKAGRKYMRTHHRVNGSVFAQYSNEVHGFASNDSLPVKIVS